MNQYGQHDLYLSRSMDIAKPAVDGLYKATIRVGSIHDDYQVEKTIEVVVRNDSIIDYLLPDTDTLNSIDLLPTYAHLDEMIFTEDKYGRDWDIVLHGH